jgi:hypothetical protein
VKKEPIARTPEQIALQKETDKAVDQKLETLIGKENF